MNIVIATWYPFVKCDIKRFMKILIIIAVLCLPVVGHAQSTGEVTKLPIPRFVSLRGDKVYARTGPGTRYPVKWVYQRKNLPVEIVNEFDTWRKVRDVDGEEGWIHQSLLSGKRYVSVNASASIPLYQDRNDAARVVALVESESIFRVNECDNGWCFLSKTDYEGWIAYNSLWGIYEGEQIE